MAFYGSSVEYGLHCILWLIQPREQPASSRDLAALQGVPPALLAKILPKLEKAGIVVSTGGMNGGYRLGRPPRDITVLDVVDAIEGGKRLFDCKEVRRGCILFGGHPPAWSGQGVCGIHAVMLRAEKTMRAELARTTLFDLVAGIRSPPEFASDVTQWLGQRAAARQQSRITAVRTSNRQRPARN